MFLYENKSINTVKEDEGTILRPTLDIFRQRSNGKPLGAVLVLPGGGYGHLAEHEGGYLASHFARMGFHAFVLKYRIAPNRFPAPQQDVLRAIRIIRANAKTWEVDPDKIAILGFSAGGHLCASCGTGYKDIPIEKIDEIDNQPSNPNAMILCYPVIDICQDWANKPTGNNLFGTQELTPQKYEWCCQNKVSDDTPPTFIWHTAPDEAVPVENSICFAKAMWAKKRKCELHVFPEGPHGIGVGYLYPNAHMWIELAAKFLKNNCDFPTV